MSEILKVRNATKSFGGLTAVHDLSFDIRRGETVGLIGPNGAGKTTLINLLCGSLYADRGEIEMEGKMITRMPPHKRCHLGLSRTYQIPRPFPELTALMSVVTGALCGKLLAGPSRGAGRAIRTDRAWFSGGSYALLRRPHPPVAHACAVRFASFSCFLLRSRRPLWIILTVHIDHAKKTVLITGTTRGLGRAMVGEFVRLGHVVLGCGRTKREVDQLRKKYGAPHDFYMVDVSSDEEVKSWASLLLNLHGPPDLVVNNAAIINKNARLWEISAREFAQVIDIKGGISFRAC